MEHGTVPGSPASASRPGSESASVAAMPALHPRVRDQLVARISGGLLELPVLPEVASQVVTLSNDANCDTRRLATLIQRDPAMAGHLMRMANSPLYSPKVPLVSLDQVVSRMGMKKVREIALIISCQSKVFAVPGYEEHVKSHFRHSLAAGAFAQEIARSRRWNVEEAFLCGLLHDVGWPVLLQELVDLHRAADVPFDLMVAESAISVLHARIGASLVTHWALPARLSETILHHHHPERSATAAQTATMAGLADDLAHLLLPLTYHPRDVDEARIRSHPLLVPLNIYPDEMDSLLAHRPRIKAMVEAIA
jgi:putative nucleotidyltransferase with HDIG domain